MEDLGLIAMLFKTSSKLQRAAASLEKFSDTPGKIEDDEKEALLWSGQFLTAIDWNAKQHPSTPVGGGLTLQATSVRPTFYSCLFRMASQLRKAGMNEEKDISTFLNILYTNLLTAGELGPGRGHKKLSSDQVKLGALLLHGMAESILVQINNNGLPKPSTTIKDEWKPTANEFIPLQAF